MNIEEQVELLMQGTEYGDAELTKAMAADLRQRLMDVEKEGRPLRVYCGYDPRTADLHIGHTVTMRKLRQFQDLGHEVTFLIGTYTSLIGDPSDKDKLRPLLTQEEVIENGRSYADLIKLGSNFTIQQFLTREAFRKRWDAGDAVYLHEFFYAIMQGYDAHALKTDVQVGGTDQLFNIVTAGRKVMSAFDEKPNIGIIMAILPGTDGVVKMSKSLGNHIPLNSTPEDMYGKVMSVPDTAMPLYAKLVTRWLPAEVSAFEKALADGSVHPRDAKMKLAHEITATYYSEAEADKGQAAFVSLFQKGDIPDEMPEHAMQEGQTVLDVILTAKLAPSKSEARRLIDQKGVRLDGEVLERGDVAFPHPGVLQVGKRKFLRVK